MKAKEVTLKKARCGVGPCPSSFKTDRGTLVIVGKMVSGFEIPRNILRKMGQGEVAIEITPDILPK